jgi:hypothetical protein
VSIKYAVRVYMPDGSVEYFELGNSYDDREIKRIDLFPDGFALIDGESETIVQFNKMPYIVKYKKI